MPEREVRPGDVRGFVIAFALGAALVLAPLLGLAARLVQLGEIAIDVGPTRSATLNGTLFADGPVCCVITCTSH